MCMKISELFDVKYGINLELINCQTTDANDPDSINFVARTANNNGVVAQVKKIEGKEPQPAGVLTCAGGGSVCSTFVQNKPFYSGRDLYILIPKREMTLNEKLYYCMCIQNNAYRYSYGRQANKSLKDIDIPDDVPKWAMNLKFSPIITKRKVKMKLERLKWEEFTLEELFEFKKGKRLIKEDMNEGNTNFLGAISENNGIRQKIDTNPIFEPNCITVNYNGSVGEAFYQREAFWASDDVNVLYAKDWELNKYIAMFIITIIKANRYRFSYGRKWTLEKMKESIIKLPVGEGKKPDWNFMESYIKSLSYSDRI